MISIKETKIIAEDGRGNKITANCDLRTTIHRVKRVKADPSLYDGYSDNGMCRQVAYVSGHTSYVGPAGLYVYIHNGIADIDVYLNARQVCHLEAEIN